MIEDFAIICGVLIFIIRMNYYILLRLGSVRYGRRGESTAYSLRVEVRPMDHPETAKEYHARLAEAKEHMRGVRS